MYKFDELSQKVKQPVIIYQADNAGVEMIGKVTSKNVIDGHYYVEVKPYGKFLVTREQYDSINIGDEMPEFLKGRKQ
ncbi:phage protein [Streptococcus suis]|uniref:Phage protein n=1 Tax=Streptococcus suis TaxID=1307 RepID=A0AAN2RHL3_STRSU|nr:phage protein [Streptococcus suis]